MYHKLRFIPYFYIMATVSIVMNAVYADMGNFLHCNYVRGVLHLVDLLVNKLVNLIVFFFSKAIIATFGHCSRGRHKPKGYTVNMGSKNFQALDYTPTVCTISSFHTLHNYRKKSLILVLRYTSLKF